VSEPVAILAGARTPFGRFGGAMRDLGIPALGATAIGGALARATLTPEDVDELVLGVNLPGSDRSIARQAALRAGIPDDRNAYTVDRACCSSMTALSLATRAIQAGAAKIAVAGGGENLSRVPFFLEGMRWGHPLGDVEMSDQLVISCPHTGVPRAVQAAAEAEEFGVTREQQDQWALRSQQRCREAIAKDLFAAETVPVEVSTSRGVERVEADESPRPGTTIEALRGLSTVYGSTTVTAGNAPGLSTGASSLVIATAAHAHERGLPTLATLIGTAMASGPPAKIASIPAIAARKLLDRLGHSIEDVDLIEINEAFAAVPLVSTLVLADGDPARADRLRERTNVNGGAIAIGHPTGATAGRMLLTLAQELRRRGGGLGLATICGGIGEGEAALIRVEG
jgi:acetyl-CoA C-acetyltransferase